MTWAFTRYGISFFTMSSSPSLHAACWNCILVFASWLLHCLLFSNKAYTRTCHRDCLSINILSLYASQITYHVHLRYATCISHIIRISYMHLIYLSLFASYISYASYICTSYTYLYFHHTYHTHFTYASHIPSSICI